ncbi:MAG TPA: glycosyltransferase family 9 protein [Candidatus Edwardsbacteria bacterium]|nr:glycosyltransferase family 9 protein [Candidatus Edwardsbacteria bacterium]
MRIGAKRILVLRSHGVGDVLWSTPFLANLRRGYPDARISYLVRQSCAPIMAGNTDVDELIVFSPRAGALRFLADLRRRRCDLSIDLIGTPRTALQSLACGAPHRIGFDFRMRRHCYNHVLSAAVANRGHEVEFNFHVLDFLGVPVTTRGLVFNLAPQELEFKQQVWRQLGYGQRDIIVGILPTGGWACKRWPVANYAALAERIAAQQPVKPLVFWGSGQEFADAKMIAAAAGPGVSIVPPTTLRQAAALLSGCSAVVGNDSGPLHIATAFGVPAVAFYGPTNPNSQGPWGTGHTVLRDESLPCLCCNRMECREPRCMTGITVDRAWAALDRTLGAMAAR